MGFAYLVTYLNRRKTWPKEAWGLRWKRVRREWTFWVVFIVTMGGILASADRARQEWNPFVSAAGGFEVLGPGRPKGARENLNAPSGPAGLHTVSFEPGGAFSFGVSYVELPPSRLAQGPEVILADVVTGTVVTPERSLLSEKGISLEGHPGRDFAFRTREGHTTRARAYVIRGRLYVLIANAAPGTAFSDEAGRFLDSFKLLTK